MIWYNLPFDLGPVQIMITTNNNMNTVPIIRVGIKTCSWTLSTFNSAVVDELDVT